MNQNNTAVAMKIMDRTISSSQLSSVSSASSLPSLASRPSTSSISDLADAASSSSQQLSLDRTTPKSSQQTMNSSAANTTATSYPQRLSPYKSFRSLRPSGPFSPANFHIIIACITLLSTSYVTAAAKHGTRLRHRKLEDEDGGGDWTGEWNGEWQADGDDYAYECSGDACNDDDSSRSSSGMWRDDIDPNDMSPEQIIMFVSVGILSFMTLLCCCCYPELMVMMYGKFCGCCGGNSAAKAAENSAEDETGGDYVGGRQDGGGSGKKKKKKRRSSRTPRKDVELV